MDNIIRLAGTEYLSAVDGPGLRMTLFFQGCPFHCKGCHNEATWDMEGGVMYTPDELLDFILTSPKKEGIPQHPKAITFSGGEPTLYYTQLIPVLEKLKSLNYDLMLFTGYTYAKLQSLCNLDPDMHKFVYSFKLIKTGPYVEHLRCWNLRFRGSSNQEIYELVDNHFENRSAEYTLEN